MMTWDSNSHETKDVGNNLSLLTHFSVTFEFKLISNQKASRLTTLCTRWFKYDRDWFVCK